MELQLRITANAVETTVIVGCQRLSLSPAGIYNSVCMVPPNGDALKTSDKQFLGPVTEYLPPLAEWLGVPPPVLVYASGQPDCLMTTSGLRIGFGVCHDASFPDWTHTLSQRGADLLALIANESFSDSDQLKHQLLACSRLRAIESRRTLVRCAAKGITGVYDGCGNRVASTRDWRALEPLVVENVPIVRGTSLYHQFGSTITWGIVAAVAIAGELMRTIPQRGAS